MKSSSSYKVSSYVEGIREPNSHSEVQNRGRQSQPHALLGGHFPYDVIKWVGLVLLFTAARRDSHLLQK